MPCNKKDRDPEVDQEVREAVVEGVNTGAVNPSPPPAPGEGVTEDEIERSGGSPGHPSDDEWAAPESGAVP